LSKGFLVGPSYTSQSVNADCQICRNWYLERDESGEGKSQNMLYPTPGKAVFATIPETQVLGNYEFNGRVFAAGNSLYELFPAGNIMTRGSFGSSNGNPVSFAANQANQLLIAAGGNLYIYSLTANVVTPVDMSQLNGPVDQIGFSDGYFVALIRNSNEFQLSNLLDGFTWDGGMVSKVEVFPENIVSGIVSFREIWFWGNRHQTAYEDTGDVFPYAPIPSAYMEQGCGAQFSVVNMDNSTFWIGADSRGTAMAWRANGYTPARISTHAIEFAWSQYPRIDDAIAYAYQDQGHTFWVLYFPSVSATWVYDAATNMWHERSFWDPAHGVFVADRSRCHCFGFGKHLVGDWATGNIYDMSINYLTDFGNPIRRVRRAIHLSEEDEWIKHHSLQIAMEGGLGPEPPLLGSNEAIYPTSITLADADGVLWLVTINDAGNLLVTELAPGGGGGFGEGGFGEGGFGTGGSSGGTGDIIFLNSFLASWQLGVTITGNLTANSVPYQGTYPSIIQLASPHNLFGLLVNSMGNVQVSLLITNFALAPRGPVMSLRWSNDYGHTWSNYYDMDAGQAGEYRKRVIKRRLGRARDRVYEISTADPFPARIIDAYLKVSA
jgi:hypothetical protein